MSASSAIPRPASTILLLRDTSAGPEVLLQRRAHGMGFMAGAFVFPGGKLDANDVLPGFFQHADLAPSEMPIFDLGADSPEQALGFYIAALRELWEEAGILLARQKEGVLVPADQPPWAGLRQSLHEGKLRFLDLLQQQELRLLPSRICYLARWVTPEVEPRRFDARFFLTAAPEGVLAAHDTLEAIESRWLRPEEAVELGRTGQILLPPPTTKTLELLRGFASTAEVLHWVTQRRPITVCPEFEMEDGRFSILLPGDPASTQRETVYPGPTRYVLEDGYWAPR